MKQVISYLLTTITLLAATQVTVYGGGRKKGAGTKASVVLVQLSTEHNRIEALCQQKKYAAAKEVAADAEKVITVMLKDFRDNFTYCPVYYYLDTNVNKIKARQFDGILLDTNLNTVANVPLHKDSKDYQVIFYGKPAVQSKRSKVQRDTTKYLYNSGEPFGRGLVVLNYKFQQLRYFYKLDYSDLFLGKRKKQYYYSSKHYDIEYASLVPELNKKIPLVYE